MSTFYENWLTLWEKNIEERKKARKVIYPEELQWVRTAQDTRAALLVAPETGFRTWGGITMIAEIPASWHTGKHSHGAEAVYIVQGKGFSIINQQKFEWEEGACIKIPFGSVHQHFNTGDKPVYYFSAMAPHLEHICLVAKFQQFEEHGETKSEPTFDRSGSDFDAKGGRLVLHLKDAQTREGGEHGAISHEVKQMQTVHHGRVVLLMGSSEEFKGEEVEITRILCDRPGSASEKHAHMEAILYTLKGEGYSIVDGEKIPWRPGTCFHVQGPQTVHQHFNNGKTESWLLRTSFGIRRFFQPIARDVFPYLFFEQGRKL